jgi:hypothetical protein
LGRPFLASPTAALAIERPATAGTAATEPAFIYGATRACWRGHLKPGGRHPLWRESKLRMGPLGLQVPKNFFIRSTGYPYKSWKRHKPKPSDTYKYRDPVKRRAQVAAAIRRYRARKARRARRCGGHAVFLSKKIFQKFSSRQPVPLVVPSCAA